MNAANSGTFLIGGDLPVHRLGFGAMQLTGPGHWGEPHDTGRALTTLRTAIDLGINHIDTADAYGPHVSENLIRRALWPYPDDLVIATKGGVTRQGPNRWQPHGDPAYLRRCVDGSLDRLAVEAIDLYYLHRIDPAFPLADQLGMLTDLQQQDKIRHLGISKVAVDQLHTARQLATIAAVQNEYSIARPDNEVHDECARTGTAYVPYRPLAAGQLAKAQQSGDGHQLTPAQSALAWLLGRSPVVLPIPGTSSPEHLRENTATHFMH